MSLRHVLVCIAAAALLAVVPSCKTVKTRVCDHLESLMDDSGRTFSRVACEEQVRLYEQSCANFEGIAQCWMAAESIGAFGACTQSCESADEAAAQ